MIFCFVCPTRLVLRRTKTRTKKNRVGYVVINIHHARTHAQQQKHHHREGRRHVEKELKSKGERTRKWYTHAHTQRSSTTMRRLFCPFLPFLSRPPPPTNSTPRWSMLQKSDETCLLLPGYVRYRPATGNHPGDKKNEKRDLPFPRGGFIRRRRYTH